MQCWRGVLLSPGCLDHGLLRLEGSCKKSAMLIRVQWLLFSWFSLLPSSTPTFMLRQPLSTVRCWSSFRSRKTDGRMLVQQLILAGMFVTVQQSCFLKKGCVCVCVINSIYCPLSWDDNCFLRLNSGTLYSVSFSFSLQIKWRKDIPEF
jgi:hypothetical protein